MSASMLIYGVGIMIFSLAFIFMISILIPNRVTKEKLEKIIGDEAISQIKKASNEDEIKQIIRNLPKKKRTKLKTLLESQDIRDVLKALDKHFFNKD